MCIHLVVMNIKYCSVIHVHRRYVYSYVCVECYGTVGELCIVLDIIFVSSMLQGVL